MIISVNWLKKFTEIDLPIEELATLIGARLVEIEEVIDLHEKYRDVIVAKVVSAAPMLDSEHLNLCKIDDGGVRENVERDENGLIQIVCGAPNILDAKLVAWLPPGAVIPETYGTNEPFILGARKLRGHMSNGMIASMRELGLGDEHDGILEIDLDAKPGDSFAKLYELDDYLLDIENKSLTHRPDCFGLIGLAREIAAIQGKEFKSPTWYTALEPVLNKTADLLAPTVKIADPKICARYEAIILKGVDGTRKSPVLIQSYLARSGMRPISAAVDITNYLMLVTGQPLHAFDYDKLAKISPKLEINVQNARNGEKMTLLDKRKIELSDNDILICAGEKPVALAGAMGGAETEIDSSTKNIVLESATFDLYALRNTQMRHGIFSEAITRFTKGQPAELTAPVLASAVRMLCDQTDAEIASEIVNTYPNPRGLRKFAIPTAKFNEVLGAKYDAETICKILQNIEFTNVSCEDDIVDAAAPWWRTDINIDEDIIEEIGRINGFDNIEPTLPARDFTAVSPAKFDDFRNDVRARLARAGANEVLSYSFIHGDVIKKSGQNPNDAFRITNAISPDLQHYRLSIVPNLLEKVNMNIRAKFDEFALFEMGKVHRKDVMDDDENDVPAESSQIGFVIAKKIGDDTAYYAAKKMLEFTFYADELTFHELNENDDLRDMVAPFEPKRSAIVKIGEQNIGVVGEFKSSVRKVFKLPEYAAGFEINLDAAYAHASKMSTNYAPLSRYPGTEKDICFRVARDLQFAQVIDAANEAMANSISEMSQKFEWSFVPIDIYRPENSTTKNVTIRVKLNNHQQTLTSDDANEIVTRIVHGVTKSLGAKAV